MSLLNTFNKVKHFYHSNQNTCRLVDFDTQKQAVIVRFKMKSPVFRLPLAEAIYKTELMSMLTPLEACWIGGHYGRLVRASVEGREMLRDVTKMHLFLKESNAPYRILSLNREQEICYCDRLNQHVFVEHPFSIVNNEALISKFDPLQACYIGFLAGMTMEKAVQQNRLGQLVKRPVKLRVVR